MDFFESQDQARRKSKLLVFYFVLAILGIATALYAVVAGVHIFLLNEYVETSAPPTTDLWDPVLFAWTFLGSLTLIGLGSLYKTAQLRGDGGKVARLLGGTLVTSDTRNPEERKLLNVVEEMAIASGVRVPEVYLLPDDSINGFAAGTSPDKAAIALTKGAVQKLSRDELQGVVAHEFSHILNGDMRLNLRLIGLVFGILLIAIIGQIILRSMGRAALLGGARRRGGGGKGGGAVVLIMVAGFAMMLIGYIGVLFGRLIQSAVSRQREFLADAAAVQFTRNPSGIAGALKKIGAAAHGAAIANPHAAETSHLFFANAMQGGVMNLFATHPPLPQRIRAIEPGFDGNFREYASAWRENYTPKETPREKQDAPEKPWQNLRPEMIMAAIGVATDSALQKTRTMLESLPRPVSEAAHAPTQAPALVYALLIDRNESVRERQWQLLKERTGPDDEQLTRQLFELLHAAEETDPIVLLDLSLPALRQVETARLSSLLETCRLLAHADESVSHLEFAILKVLGRNLAAKPRTTATKVSLHSAADATTEILLLLGLLAQAGGTGDSAERNRLVQAGTARLPGWPQNRALPSSQEEISLNEAESALDSLEKASPSLKKSLIEAALHTIYASGRVEQREVFLLRAFCAALDCPMPPVHASGN